MRYKKKEEVNNTSNLYLVKQNTLSLNNTTQKGPQNQANE